jgi:hypothetical protein
MAVTNPDALAAIISDLGGIVIPHRTFRFELPLAQVREVVPKITELTGLRVEKVAERQDSGDVRSNDRTISIALELKHQREPDSYDRERNLMKAIVR